MNNIETTFGRGVGAPGANIGPIKAETTKNADSNFISLRSKSNDRDSIGRTSAGEPISSSRWANSRPSYPISQYQDREKYSNKL